MSNPFPVRSGVRGLDIDASFRFNPHEVQAAAAHVFVPGATVSGVNTGRFFVELPPGEPITHVEVTAYSASGVYVYDAKVTALEDRSFEVDLLDNGTLSDLAPLDEASVNVFTGGR